MILNEDFYNDNELEISAVDVPSDENDGYVEYSAKYFYKFPMHYNNFQSLKSKEFNAFLTRMENAFEDIVVRFGGEYKGTGYYIKTARPSDLCSDQTYTKDDDLYYITDESGKHRFYSSKLPFGRNVIIAYFMFDIDLKKLSTTRKTRFIISIAETICLNGQPANNGRDFPYLDGGLVYRFSVINNGAATFKEILIDDKTDKGKIQCNSKAFNLLQLQNSLCDDRASYKIDCAEILTAILSLMDSDYKFPDAVKFMFKETNGNAYPYYLEKRQAQDKRDTLNEKYKVWFVDKKYKAGYKITELFNRAYLVVYDSIPKIVDFPKENVVRECGDRLRDGDFVIIKVIKWGQTQSIVVIYTDMFKSKIFPHADDYKFIVFEQKLETDKAFDSLFEIIYGDDAEEKKINTQIE